MGVNVFFGAPGDDVVVSGPRCDGWDLSVVDAWSLREKLNAAVEDGYLREPLLDEFTNGNHVHARVGRGERAGMLVFPASKSDHLLARPRTDEFIEWLLAQREAGAIGSRQEVA